MASQTFYSLQPQEHLRDDSLAGVKTVLSFLEMVTQGLPVGWLTAPIGVVVSPMLALGLDHKDCRRLEARQTNEMHLNGSYMPKEMAQEWVWMGLRSLHS